MPAPSNCNFQLPAIPTPPIPIPLGVAAVAAAILAAIDAAEEALRTLPIAITCPLD